MSIQNGDFIKVSYTGKRDDGSIFDTTDEQVAKDNNIYNEKGKYGEEIIMVGAGHTAPGLDEDFEGKEVGYSGSVTLPPEKAFGHRNPELIETLPLRNFEQRPEVGMPVNVEGKLGTVIRVIGRTVQVDFNRYLAGQTVIYDYEIKEKIEDEEGKVKGLFNLYLGKELAMDINNGNLTVEIETEMTFDQKWLMSKGRIASEIINNTDINEVIYLEKYNKEKFEPKKDPETVEEKQDE